MTKCESSREARSSNRISRLEGKMEGRPRKRQWTQPPRSLPQQICGEKFLEHS